MQAPASMGRREFLGLVTSLAAAASGLSAPARAAAQRGARRPKALWKTAVGLNGFESGERKYRKRYPLWEVLDFARTA